jgi:hypothetical protein
MDRKETTQFIHKFYSDNELVLPAVVVLCTDHIDAKERVDRFLREGYVCEFYDDGDGLPLTHEFKAPEDWQAPIEDEFSDIRRRSFWGFQKHSLCAYCFGGAVFVFRHVSAPMN